MGWVMPMLGRFMSPPPMPPVELPFLPPRMKAGVLAQIEAAFKLAYERGLLDGFILGVLFALLFVPGLRHRAKEGVSSVLDHFAP